MNNRAAQQQEIVKRRAARDLAWQQTLSRGAEYPDAGSNAYPWPVVLK